MTSIPEVLKQKFFSDPDWGKVEAIILDYIEPLRDMSDIDKSLSAEAYKAEVVGRLISYERLSKFLSDTQMVSTPRTDKPKNPFR